MLVSEWVSEDAGKLHSKASFSDTMNIESDDEALSIFSATLSIFLAKVVVTWIVQPNVSDQLHLKHSSVNGHYNLMPKDLSFSVPKESSR